MYEWKSSELCLVAYFMWAIDPDMTDWRLEVDSDDN